MTRTAIFVEQANNEDFFKVKNIIAKARRTSAQRGAQERKEHEENEATKTGRKWEGGGDSIQKKKTALSEHVNKEVVFMKKESCYSLHRHQSRPAQDGSTEAREQEGREEERKQQRKHQKKTKTLI